VMAGIMVYCMRGPPVPGPPVPRSRSPVPLPARGFATSRRNGMNGAQALIRTLAGCGVDVCFSNPGTSEMHFVAPLESDIDALAGSVSSWIRRPARSADLAADAARAVAEAMRPPGAIATLILPADASWSEGADPAPPLSARTPAAVPDDVIASAAAALRSGEPCVILLGGAAVRRPGLEAASRLAQATGCRLLCETFPARHERGAGIPALERLAYLAEFATAQLAGTRHLILAGARAPVSFFAYPGQPSSLTPAGAQIHVL